MIKNAQLLISTNELDRNNFLNNWHTPVEGKKTLNKKKLSNQIHFSVSFKKFM